MPEKVYLRFVKKKKDGTNWKLRIQDVPPARFDEALDLQAEHFPRDETLQKAIGTSKNPDAIKEYKGFLNSILREPTSRVMICCEDNDEEVGDTSIMGISCVAIAKEKFDWLAIVESLKEGQGTPEGEKGIEVFHGISEKFCAIDEFKLNVYLEDLSVLVLPDYRGHGIAQQFLRARRIMCAELDIPLTGGWMTGYGTQVAADRDEWRTVYERDYDELGRLYNLVFEDAPPKIKYMVAGAAEEK